MDLFHWIESFSFHQYVTPDIYLDILILIMHRIEQNILKKHSTTLVAQMTGKSTVSKPPTVLSSPQIMFFLVYTIQMSLYYTNSAAYLSAGMVEKVHQAISVLDYNSVKINVYDSCAWVFYTSAGRSCRMDCPACLAYSLSRPLSLCHPVVVTFSISLLC